MSKHPYRAYWSYADGGWWVCDPDGACVPGLHADVVAAEREAAKLNAAYRRGVLDERRRVRKDAVARRKRLLPAKRAKAVSRGK